MIVHTLLARLRAEVAMMHAGVVISCETPQLKVSRSVPNDAYRYSQCPIMVLIHGTPFASSVPIYTSGPDSTPPFSLLADIASSVSTQLVSARVDIYGLL